nr:MAG TPA: hypothetical protein [Caudoviricetes sp.]DAX96187.1 MAG TPA: hypothetical protein [Bacteriophage sp.]
MEIFILNLSSFGYRNSYISKKIFSKRGAASLRMLYNSSHKIT